MHNIDGLAGIVLSIMLMLCSVLMNWFDFIDRADKVIMQPVLHFTQLVAAITAIVGVLYTIWPGFKRWLSNKLEEKE